MSVKVLLAAVGLAGAAQVSAIQPLDEFLSGARMSSVDNAEARAVRRQLGAEADAELGRALPRLSLRGVYSRNQYDTTIELPGTAGGPATSVRITPHDQLDGAATLDVPLVDLASFARIASARTGAKAAATQAASTELRVQSLVSQNYYQLVANLALVEASREALDVARASLRIAEERHGAGTTALLDVDRARAEVERNVQQLAAAELQVSLVARALQSLTGISPALEGEGPVADDLHEELPLERFQAPDDKIPALAAAIQSRVASDQAGPGSAPRPRPQPERERDRAGDQRRGARRAGCLLAVSRSASAGPSISPPSPGIRAQDAAADAARAREERARLAARDDIHSAWTTVRTNIARSRSARVQSEVSARAAELALERYQAGAATQLDLLQTQRDAFAAAAARIQADADLVNSRAQLRVAAGAEPPRPAGEGGAVTHAGSPGRRCSRLRAIRSRARLRLAPGPRGRGFPARRPPSGPASATRVLSGFNSGAFMKSRTRQWVVVIVGLVARRRHPRRREGGADRQHGAGGGVIRAAPGGRHLRQGRGDPVGGREGGDRVARGGAGRRPRRRAARHRPRDRASSPAPS